MLAHFLWLISSLVLAGGCCAAQVFEPEDFNITQALVEQGVDLSIVPALAALSERSSTVSSCSIACASLQSIFGAQSVALPLNGTSTSTYASFTGAYWSSIQSDVQPRCIFFPSASSHVSVLVLVSRLARCPFAVKSGGHAAFAGASSSEGGITVAMRNMDGIRLSGDGGSVSIQPGNNWSAIYTSLAPYDLAVIGGRVASIGIGGLLTGGGISFFSSIYGLACDNVVSYEVVTASGAIITASVDKHPDLYWALRGGGNNFGIVVAFTLETIPLPGGAAAMWGGSRLYAESDFPAVMDAFAGVIADSPADPRAGTWVAWAVVGNNGSWTRLSSAELWYAEPDGGGAAIFDAFEGIAALQDTTRNVGLAEYADVVEEANPDGLRECYYALTVKASTELLRAAKDIWFEEVESVLGLDGAGPAMVWQGITLGELHKMTKNGGNPLGLCAEDGPLYLVQVSSWWDKEEDDAAMYTMISTVLTRIKAVASSLGVQNDYVYMNYASQFQHVIGSYGSENKARLKSIAERYDPRHVFQTLQPGYFKLDRAPVPNSTYFNF